MEVFLSTEKGYLHALLATPGQSLQPGQAVAVLTVSPNETIPEDEYVKASQFDCEAFDWSEIDVRDGPAETMTPMRQTIARRMLMSKRHIPCFYLTTAIDMTGCMDLRLSLRKHGEKATYNDMAIKASSIALTRYPKVAGIFVPEGFQPRKHLNIGFAAALADNGLVVPVVKDADKKTLTEISAETRMLASKAKKGELEPADCSGGVFSVSYLGAFEVDEFVAIVNPGEAAILAASKIVEKPVVVSGEIAIRPIMKVTLSYDHRTIDGALGARFAGEIKSLLEKPEQLL